jgi:hypothetical protein
MRMRDLAASSDEKPLRVESSSPEKFRFRMNRSHPEGGQLLLCISTVRMALAGSNQIGTAQRKTPKGGQKERSHREENGNSAGSVKNFQAPAMLKTTPLDCEIKGNLREKRRDPWPRANASPQAMADPEPVVKTRTKIRRRVLTWFAGRWRNHQPKRAEKPHSKSAAPKGAGRPCYEADNSACRGEWRRESGSPREGARLMPVREREHGDLPSPICPGSVPHRGIGPGLIVFWYLS